MPNQRNRRRTEAGDSSGGASGQGGAGGAGKGGWIHISDNRRPPEFGRIAWYVTDVVSEDRITTKLYTGPRISLAVSKLMGMVNLLAATANTKVVVCCESLLVLTVTFFQADRIHCRHLQNGHSRWNVSLSQDM